MTEHAEDPNGPITLGNLADQLAARWPADRRIIVQNVIGWVQTLADGEGFTVLDESTELPPKLADAIRYDYDAVGYRAGRTPQTGTEWIAVSDSEKALKAATEQAATEKRAAATTQQIIDAFLDGRDASEPGEPLTLEHLAHRVSGGARLDRSAVVALLGEALAMLVNDRTVLMAARDDVPAVFGWTGHLGPTRQPQDRFYVLAAHVALWKAAARKGNAVRRSGLPPYTPDPVARLRHVVAYHDRQMDDAWAVQASPLRLPGAVQGWTGLTHGDLRALLALIERRDVPPEEFLHGEIAQDNDGRLFRRFEASGGTKLWEPVQDTGYVLGDDYPTRPLTRPRLAPVPQRD